MLVEGRRAVAEALDAGAAVRFAVASERLDGDPEGNALTTRLVASAVELVVVPDAELGALAATHSPQGILMVCEEPRSDLDDLLMGKGAILVLDAIQDPGNAGTLIRSATAFGFAGVVCLDGTVDPWGGKAVRASAGSVFRLPLAQADAALVVEAMARARRQVLVADAGGRPAGQVAPPNDGATWRPALVVGNEGAGVRPAIREAAHVMVAVPMAGPVESLNAGVAGSILMYELMKERT